jgi:hypothetical protein
VERPASEVVERERRHAEVVADQIALRQAGFWEEHLVRVRDRNVVAADAHAPSMKAANREGASERPLSMPAEGDYETREPLKESQLAVPPPSSATVPFRRETPTRAVVVPLGPAVAEQTPPRPSVTLKAIR